jgi:hypothetical protein
MLLNANTLNESEFESEDETESLVVGECAPIRRWW